LFFAFLHSLVLIINERSQIADLFFAQSLHTFAHFLRTKNCLNQDAQDFRIAMILLKVAREGDKYAKYLNETCPPLYGTGRQRSGVFWYLPN
jgi:hypothetical protein